MQGPIERLEYAPARFADLYLIRFDKDGRLLSPNTARRFLDSTEVSTDVFVFSHGWNNIFAQALDKYRSFIGGYVRQRGERQLPMPEPYNPVLLGIIWPSTSVVLPWESGPDIAGAGDPTVAREQEEMLGFVMDSLDPEASATFTELVDGQVSVDGQEANVMAEIVRTALLSDGDPDVGRAGPSVEDLLVAWRALDEITAPAVSIGDEDDFGTVDGEGSVDEGGAPAAAGGTALDPRNLLRTATLWKMKARAGVVGANGVGPVVREVLARSSARVHLVGHSFGARVVLSALASGNPPRRARSVLLLQPAINRWCFAPTVEGTGKPGGYNVVLDRVEQPIFTTFSSADQPLHEFFHLAVRGASLGEPDIAAIGDTHLFGALGGYGPEGLGGIAKFVDAVDPGGDGYDTSRDCQVLAIDGSAKGGVAARIAGHSDISNPVTWWAMHHLTRPPA